MSSSGSLVTSGARAVRHDTLWAGTEAPAPFDAVTWR
jgi:hypothetical protein